ncbi:uncharacterized protein LOC126550359 [Aphis gossypii]|uniref:Ankyrin repeat domain containing protein n=1 Tax=Aphis gossypii TaxID=80765 RepID=A0A9P0IW64_APHGO|nr:uncharacterized protein LOC126550359 [Aphis gossypii]CAH1721726.1 unnamed protein product [Aphis gossypii]
MATAAETGRYAVPSLFKSAYRACNEAQRHAYRTDCPTLPAVDLRPCCSTLFEILKANAEGGGFDPHGDRRHMYRKAVRRGRVFAAAATVCATAAGHGHVDCLRLAHEIGCPWDASTPSVAALGGHLDCLMYMHENACPWDERTCTKAAGAGHLHCLRYARENGCPWHELTCADAAAGGHLDCLKYAHEYGCPWDEHTCFLAAMLDQLACLVYAHQNGCPWDRDYTDRLFISRRCLEYAFNVGCPNFWWTTDADYYLFN